MPRIVGPLVNNNKYIVMMRGITVRYKCNDYERSYAPMNLKALRCCVEIVRQGSFTKAAQHLHIAQPALSMAVTRLEEELGVTLFNRTTRKVLLTAEGEQFLPRIASALREMDVARQELRDMADLKRGEVRLGIPPMFGLHYVPGLMNAFRQSYPGIAMTVFEGSAADIGQRLEQREIDLALLESRRVPQDKESILLGSDEMLACMHPDHPYAGKAFLTAEDLRNTDMVVFDRTFVQRHLLDAFFAEHGITYQVALQSNFVSLVVQAALDNMGVATLLRSVQQRTPGIVGVPFRPAQQMSFRLCWRSGEYLSLASKRFIDFAAQTHYLER